MELKGWIGIAVAALLLIALVPTGLAQPAPVAQLAAPEIATLGDGRRVVLNPDGSWKFEESRDDAPPAEAPPAGRLIKTPRGKFGIYINDAKWKQDLSQEDANKMSFDHKAGDAYAMVIAERIAMPLETLKKVALTNAREAAPDAKVTLEENRTVRGHSVLCMQIQGTIEGIPFVYYGYYYGGEQGTIQVITYTTTNLLEEFRADFEEFLNGLSVNPQ